MKTILLGLIQGVTEFLPVSSSGHLILFKHILDMDQVPKLFDILLHVATLLVVITVFRKEIMKILVSWLHSIQRCIDDQDRYYLRLTLVIILGSACTAVLGLLLKDIEIFQSIRFVSLSFLVTGVFLISTKYVKTPVNHDLKISHAFWVGIAQGIGTLPGISRSGITITAALWGGMDRKAAGELSFLMSIPAIVGAFFLERGESSALATEMSLSEIGIGCLAAVVSGYISLRLLLRLIQSGKLYYFSLYLIPLGIVGLVFLS